MMQSASGTGVTGTSCGNDLTAQSSWATESDRDDSLCHHARSWVTASSAARALGGWESGSGSGSGADRCP